MGCHHTKCCLLSERRVRVIIFPGCFCPSLRVQRWQLFVPLLPSDQYYAALLELPGYSENSRALSECARSAEEVVALPVPFAPLQPPSRRLYAQDGHLRVEVAVRCSPARQVERRKQPPVHSI